EDSPPDYLAFRESAINLLIHQDYADHNRKATIYVYKDRMVLHNPGDSFADTDELLEPGAKPLRNPRIVAALRRIGLNEEAGTGLTAREAQAVLDRLLVEVLVEEISPGNRTHVQLAAHLVDRLGSITAEGAKLVSDQPTTKPANLVSDQPLRSLNDTQRTII